MSNNYESNCCDNKTNKCVRGDVCLYKTLLNRCEVKSPNYLIVTFDITLINKMKDKIVDVSLKDSLSALQYACSDIKFEISSYSKNLVTLGSQEILEKNGELLDISKSSLPPKSASRLILKVTINQKINYEQEDLKCKVNICYNSITLNGTIKKVNEKDCSFTEEKLQPISLCTRAYGLLCN